MNARFRKPLQLALHQEFNSEYLFVCYSDDKKSTMFVSDTFMKKSNEKPHKEKKFLVLPTYPGGKQAFVAYITENLRYPEEAIENSVEGTVYLSYSVDDTGLVCDETIIHGIGYGCDEEALRLIRSLKYDPVRNRGIRVKSKMKTRIRFDLPGKLKNNSDLQLNYTSAARPENEKPEQAPRISYNYTIKLE
jgi:TonB family protein